LFATFEVPLIQQNFINYVLVIMDLHKQTMNTLNVTASNHRIWSECFAHQYEYTFIYLDTNCVVKGIYDKSVLIHCEIHTVYGTGTNFTS